MWGDGYGWVPDEPKPLAKVALLAQNPGADEERGQMIVGYAGKRNPVYEQTTPRPLIGMSGYFLTTQLFPCAQITRNETSLHNVLKCRWNHTNTLPTGDMYEQAVAHCTKHHLEIPETVEVLVAHGAAAWSHTQGSHLPVSEWRGFIGPRLYQGKRVYATLHTADLLRDPHARFVSRLDWKRLRRVIEGRWPLRVPESTLGRPQDRGLFIRTLEEACTQPEIMVDTEYIVDKQLMTHVGAAWRVGETVRGFQLEWLRGSATTIERGIFMRYWKIMCEKVCMGFWNAKADLPILQANLHQTPRSFEDPMQAHAVLWPDMDHDYAFVASIYGKYNKLKHLSKEDILLYHWGDCIDLVWIWEQLKEEFKNDQACEKRYREQNLKLIPILLGTEARGIRVHQSRIQEALPVYEALTQDAGALAASFAGYPINLGSPVQLISHLLSSEGVKLRSVDKDVVAAARAKYLPFDSDEEEANGFSFEYVTQRIAQGAHPLLETRTMYAQNSQVITHYLLPLSQVGRCYPSINIHTQAGGRHSTTNPPLATLPNDLRDIILPDEGQVWIGWDWDAQEPRIQGAESGSRILAAAFNEGHDIHTLFVCQLYGWDYPTDRRDPHGSEADRTWRHTHQWGGKDDPRRVFAKTTRYEINYGGDGSQAAKKAVRMGIEPAVAKKAAQVLMESDPDLAGWFRRVEHDVVRTHVVRSWAGSRRIFYWVDSWSNPDEMRRQARNFPPQGGGADLYNLTIVEIAEKVPAAKFVFGMHDSMWFSLAKETWFEHFSEIKRIATQHRLINNTLVAFPGTFKVMYDDGKVEKVKE